MNDRTVREEACHAFLEAAGWKAATRASLAGDASARKYERLARPEGSAVLMDAPPSRGEDIRPFVRMTRWLHEHGLSAPRILAEAPDAGFLLLEDLGDALYARHVAQTPTCEPPLYAEAVKLMAHLADLPPPTDLAPYDRQSLAREAALFSEWWLPNAAPDASAWRIQDYQQLIDATMPVVEHARDTVVLRDYHAENLVWLADRSGIARVGLLDYQDALVGHAAYDLMSLLEDARRDTSAELRAAMIDLYLSMRPALDADAFRRDYAILGAQRNLKIVGIFARLALRDGKPRYLDLIPRVWAHVKRDLAHPSLAGLRAWITAHAPEPTPEVLRRVAGQSANQTGTR